MNLAFKRETHEARDKILRSNFKQLLRSPQTRVRGLAFWINGHLQLSSPDKATCTAAQTAPTHTRMAKDTERIFTQKNLSSGISSHWVGLWLKINTFNIIVTPRFDFCTGTKNGKLPLFTSKSHADFLEISNTLVLPRATDLIQRDPACWLTAEER